MTDIQTIEHPFKNDMKVLNVSYEFRGMPYLVADKYGNFFILPHCQNKRTSNFKQLKTKGYIYYQGNKIRTSTLRKRVINSNLKIEI